MAVIIEWILEQCFVELVKPIDELRLERSRNEIARSRRGFGHDAGYRLAGEVLSQVLESATQSASGVRSRKQTE